MRRLTSSATDPVAADVNPRQISAGAYGGYSRAKAGRLLNNQRYSPPGTGSYLMARELVEMVK